MASGRERVAMGRAGRRMIMALGASKQGIQGGSSHAKGGGSIIGMKVVVGVGNSIFIAAPAPATNITNLGGPRGTLSEEKS